jgi:hypothetical protein
MVGIFLVGLGSLDCVHNKNRRALERLEQYRERYGFKVYATYSHEQPRALIA